MENKQATNIKKYENEVNKISEEFGQLETDLTSIKKEVNFNQLLKDYKKTKKNIYKSERDIKKNNDENKTEELKKNLSSFEQDKKNQTVLFDKVGVVERKIYKFKDNVDKLIKKLDDRKRYSDLEAKRSTNDLSRKMKYLEEEYLISLKNDLKIIKKEESKIQKQIDSANDSLKPTKSLEFKLKEQTFKSKDLEKEISYIENLSQDMLNKVKVSIAKSKTKISNANKYSDSLQTLIDNLLELVTRINDSLSFKDADEINLDTSFSVKYLNVWYGSKQALYDINIDFPKNQVISIIGPSGCGKSTFLRTLNRINDNVPNFKAKGKILFDGEYDVFKLRSIRNRYDKIELSTLRTKVGMIFQQPNPFPMSIYKNVTFGPKVRGVKNKSILNELTENSLKDAGLWEEVKDNLKALGPSLSGGQQQRLCIARAIANQPEILLMDEPTSALDPIAAKKVEDLILKLKEHYTIIMVTHSMQQAARISDKTAFFYQGELIEYGDTEKLFNNPQKKETRDYITGKFG